MWRTKNIYLLISQFMRTLPLPYLTTVERPALIDLCLSFKLVITEVQDLQPAQSLHPLHTVKYRSDRTRPFSATKKSTAKTKTLNSSLNRKKNKISRSTHIMKAVIFQGRK